MNKDLIEKARQLPPDEYLALLAELVRADEEADRAAARARDDVDLVIAVALIERRDVSRRRMELASEIDYRVLYKRRDRVRRKLEEDLLAG